MIVYGYRVAIPALDRGHQTSMTIGGNLLFPKQGDTAGFPFLALYLRRVEDRWRTRDMVSFFVNDLEYDRRFGKLELVTQLESVTLPSAQTEVINGAEANPTSASWGTVIGSLGPGIRLPVAPFEVDNDLRVQLTGRAGYFYAGRTDQTGSNLLLPPDTLLYGARLRLRYDNLRRNLLELPHRGWAAGFDADYLVRDRWHETGLRGSTSPSGPSDYLHLSGHLVGVGGVPGWSERHRFLFTLYGGTTELDQGDRFNAYRLNGGPFPCEGDDLPRPHYTGIVFNDVLATRYLTGSVGYRRELTFFLYLTVLGSYIWADRATPAADGTVAFRDTTAVSTTASVDCAFLWNSSIYLAYSWDSGIIRNGTPGHGVLLTWNKLF